MIHNTKKEKFIFSKVVTQERIGEIFFIFVFCRIIFFCERVWLWVSSSFHFTGLSMPSSDSEISS